MKEEDSLLFSAEKEKEVEKTMQQSAHGCIGCMLHFIVFMIFFFVVISIFFGITIKNVHYEADFFPPTITIKTIEK